MEWAKPRGCPIEIHATLVLHCTACFYLCGAVGGYAFCSTTDGWFGNKIPTIWMNHTFLMIIKRVECNLTKVQRGKPKTHLSFFLTRSVLVYLVFFFGIVSLIFFLKIYSVTWHLEPHRYSQIISRQAFYSVFQRRIYFPTFFFCHTARNIYTRILWRPLLLPH